jgi:hypothetical protein
MVKTQTKIPTIFVLIILMASSILLTTTNTGVSAANQSNLGIPLPAGVTPVYERTTYAYLSVSPNPIGIGQQALVNIWTTPGLDRFKAHHDYTVTITHPDGTTEKKVMDSYWADATSWFTFTPDATGEWKLKFEFFGSYFPNGTYADPRATGGVDVRAWDEYYKPSSTKETTLVVQNEPVQPYPDVPLPTDYWTRPIPAENRDWWIISGNYPWYGPGGGEKWDELYPDTNPYWSARQKFTPWTLGPESGHIVWTDQQDLTAGLLGGDLTSIFTVGTGANPNILYNGLGYMSTTEVVNGFPTPVWQCFDIRTGELKWQRTNVTEIPTIIEYDTGVSAAPVPGAGERPLKPELLYMGGGRLMKYSPSTGALNLNVSIAPMTGSGGTYFTRGMVLGVQDLGSSAGAGRYRLINWTTIGTATNFADRVIGNITWPWSNLGTTQDFNTGLAATISGGGRDVTQIRVADMVAGKELWNTTSLDSVYMTQTAVADHGKIAMLMRGGFYEAWDMRSGALAWKSELGTYPWSEAGWASYGVASAYGMIYQQYNDGILAFNWTNGKIVWRYQDVAKYQFENPYTGINGTSVIPMYNFGFGMRIVDGKIYVANAVHSPQIPLERGWGVHSINALTGERVWRVSIPSHTHAEAATGYVHDGYFTFFGGDGIMYVFGKGLSATTVTAPSTQVQVGQKLTITGTVLDMSPAQSGTAAISEKDMSAWMEYMHKQAAKPTDATGVTVDLTAFDPNGNIVNIGQATSNTDGTFGFSWAPEVSGLYEITARFAGSASYGSSTASTYFTAIDGPTPPTQTPIALTATETYFVPAIAGIIAAILAVGVILALVMIRKRT